MERKCVHLTKFAAISVAFAGPEVGQIVMAAHFIEKRCGRDGASWSHFPAGGCAELSAVIERAACITLGAIT